MMGIFAPSMALALTLFLFAGANDRFWPRADIAILL
jgi:hypothetical protein